MEHAGIALPGVEILEQAGRGAHSVVYRARRRGIDVAVKLCRPRAGAAIDGVVKLFAAEAASLSRIRHPGVVGLVDHALDESGLPYLITRYVPGRTLAEVLAAGRALSVGETVRLLCRLADALQVVHRSGVVHRDINPSNIVVGNDGAPTLIDFGLAAVDDVLLARVVGTLAYTAPEQSGSLHLSVDHRADLYSLGAVAYECLAGEPPFGNPDVETLLRLHARSRPPSLCELRADVPQILSAIVSRLLGKDPEDRYPTAASLHWDLAHLADLHHESELARRHRTPEIELSQPLHGRSDVLADLRAGLPDEHAARGATLVVRGARGSGVTRVGRELVHDPGLPCTPLWAKSRPKAALLSVVHEWLSQLSAALAELSEDRAEALRTTLRATVGDVSAGVLREFSVLSPWLSIDETAAESGSIESVYDTVVDVIACCAGELPTLTFVVDDAEHLDGASAAVLRRLHSASRSRPLTLLVLAHAADDPVLRELVDGASVAISLQPLTAEAAHELVCDYLGYPDFDRDVSGAFVRTSGGNPGALLDYIATLLDGGALRFADDHFHLDAERLQKLSLPDDIAELALSRAQRLDAESTLLLGIAALYGGRFDVELVAKAGNTDVVGVMRSVTVAQAARLVRSHGDNRFAFVDRRVADRLSEQVPAEARRVAHEVYAVAAEQEPEGAGLLRAADHRFAAATESTAEICIAVCRRAGERACEQTAWGEARTYLGKARTLSERFHRPLDSDFYGAEALAYANSGDSERGLACFEQAIESCRDPWARAELNLRVAEMHMAANFDIERMEVNLERCWRDLGSRLPRNSPLQALGFLVLPLVTWFMDRTGIGVGVRRGEPRAKLMFRLAEATLKWAYLKNYLFVLLGMIFRPFYQALRVGRGPELAIARAGHAANLASLGVPQKVVRAHLDQAFTLARALNDRVALARVEYWQAVSESARGNMVAAADGLEVLLEKRGRFMHINDYFFAAVDVCINLSLRGYNRRATSFLERCLDDLVARSGAEVAEARLCRDLLVANRASYERPQEVAKKFDAEVEKLASVREDSFVWFQIWYSQLGLWFEIGDRERYDEAIACGERSGRSPAFAGWQFAYFWVLKGLCRAEQALHSAGEDRERRVRQLEACIKELKVSRKFPFIACTVDLLRGWVAYFRGDWKAAVSALGVAEAGAISSDNPMTRFWVLVARARMLHERGEGVAAELDVRQALALCEAQGWTQRASRVRQEFALRPGARPTSSSRGGGATTGLAERGSPEAARLRRERDALLDVGEAIAAVQDPAQQADIALDRVRGLLGAERAAWCALSDEGELVLTAVHTEADDATAFEAEELAGLWEQVRQTREAAVLNGEDEIVRRVGRRVARRGVRSLICAPVLLRDEPVGVITLDTRVSRGAFTAGDVDMLAAVATQIAIGQETARSMQRELQRQALDRDLQLSAAVQALLLPRTAAVTVGGLRSLGHFLPASRAAGDFWYAEPTARGDLIAFLGDVTGHGAGPAMVTAVLAGCYRSLADTGTLSTPELLVALDRSLSALCAGTYTVAFSAIELDPKTGRGRLWAGASPPVLIRAVDGSVRTLGQAGRPLGVGEGVGNPLDFELEPGELLWMFTDGLNELPMPGGRELGLRRVRNMLAKTSSHDLSQCRDGLLSQVGAAVDMRQRDDDLTFILVQRDPAG
jgi:serine phosphatase RsbU (regulator of sigma subunit)/tRNA A-37 threonylcarbamoyl transferase component Bud32/tetratricopeptide (TPR) repeat protein